MMLRYVLVFALALAALPVTAAETPRWAVEVKGGHFKPDIDGWKEHYGDDSMEHFAAAVAFKFFSFLEFGLEGGRTHAQGVGDQIQNGITNGTVNTEYFPVHASLTLRAIFVPSQWIVPYVGGGFTRMYYRQDVKDQGKTEGSVDGQHLRAGLQFLLDALDASDTANLRRSGIEHSYLFVEAQDISAKDETIDVDIGGLSTLIGLRLEF